MDRILTWQPNQYLSFKNERFAPICDLINAIPLDHEPRSILDLGCGAGSAFSPLKERWKDATLTGVDSSKAMLNRAKETGIADHLIESDIATWQTNDRYDLIFSNAALHWIDNHADFLKRAYDWLELKGYIAIQMPNNWEEPTHRISFALANEERWSYNKPLRLRTKPVLSIDEYHQIFSTLNFPTKIWEKRYESALAGDNPVLEWLKGTTLTSILSALDPEQHAEFLSELAARLQKAYPKNKAGLTPFYFRRLFILAGPKNSLGA